MSVRHSLTSDAFAPVICIVEPFSTHLGQCFRIVALRIGLCFYMLRPCALFSSCAFVLCFFLLSKKIHTVCATLVHRFEPRIHFAMQIFKLHRIAHPRTVFTGIIIWFHSWCLCGGFWQNWYISRDIVTANCMCRRKCNCQFKRYSLQWTVIAYFTLLRILLLLISWSSFRSFVYLCKVFFKATENRVRGYG